MWNQITATRAGILTNSSKPWQHNSELAKPSTLEFLEQQFIHSSPPWGLSGNDLVNGVFRDFHCSLWVTFVMFPATTMDEHGPLA